MEAHVPRKLDAQMSKTADALHSDQISAAQTSIAKSVEGRNTSAEERSGFRGPEFIGNGGDASRFSDHQLRITSIHRDSWDHGILTIHHVATSAWFTNSVFAAEEAETDSLADLPPGHPTT
jgi:hypothetical protein